MRPQKPFPVGTTERMKQLLMSTDSLSEYRRIQSIYLRAKYGYSAEQIADMVGLKRQTVCNLHAAYRKEGETALHVRLIFYSDEGNSAKNRSKIGGHVGKSPKL